MLGYLSFPANAADVGVTPCQYIPNDHTPPFVVGFVHHPDKKKDEYVIYTIYLDKDNNRVCHVELKMSRSDFWEYFNNVVFHSVNNSPNGRQLWFDHLPDDKFIVKQGRWYPCSDEGE